MYDLELDPTRPDDTELLPREEARALRTLIHNGGVTWTKVEPPNCRRFYHLLVQRDLFGEWSLVRVWGRLPGGSHPRMLAENYPDLATLWEGIPGNRKRRGLLRQVRRRTRRGYRPRVAAA